MHIIVAAVIWAHIACAVAQPLRFPLPKGLTLAGVRGSTLVLIPLPSSDSRINVIAERTHVPEPLSFESYLYVSRIYESRIHESYVDQDEDEDP